MRDEPSSDPPPSPSTPSPEPTRAAVDLTDATRALSARESAFIVEHLRAAIDFLGATGEVRIRAVRDAEMAAAHARHLGTPETTDALTFDLADASAGPARALDADILVCVDEAQRRSAEHAHGPERELLLYALHGVLHCLGYDDHSPDAARRMHQEEDRVLDAVGVGPIFSAAPPKAPAAMRGAPR